ncbi:hypothetical protein DLM78_14405 [Leptospira stimsonii]|uniref:Uncharacterized protein n=1 Tax=Leptospira stimsonii TaxID=2202203 RepID=A0A8B3CPN2_9LEPT|nr:hypothetical protein DLM78_14405 [Leptospira stimsonii]
MENSSLLFENRPPFEFKKRTYPKEKKGGPHNSPLVPIWMDNLIKNTKEEEKKGRNLRFCIK